jgi:pimeloyl-ACP methyl ester carboxylesterase
MPIITLEGRALHYIEFGPRDATLNLIFIHGAGGSLDIWASILPTLTEFHAIALDLPGHGRSAPPGRRSVEQYALLVERFVSELNLENLVLVGHSMGSAIALTIAQRSLIQIRGLILFGASARMPVGDALLGGSLTALEGVAAFIAEQGIIDAPTDQRESVARQVLACGATTTFGDFMACNRFDLRAKLSTLDVPTLVIAGRLDRMTPLRFSESLVDGLPQAQLFTLEGTGHFAMLERSESIKPMMANFLRDLASPEARRAGV